jgi:hypothetical protein
MGTPTLSIKLLAKKDWMFDSVNGKAGVANMGSAVIREDPPRRS